MKFAVIENGVVLNTILCDSQEIAEQLTGKTCIQYTDEPAEIGGTYVDNKFIKSKPFPSWVRTGEADWKPPVEYPNIDAENPKYYSWNEEIVFWVESE